MPRGKRELLIFLADTCPVAVTAIPRVLRIIRSVAAAGFFAYFRGSFPCRRRTSRYFAGSAPCHRWAHFLFSQDLPLVATKLRTSFARLVPLPPLGSMRLLRSLPRCGATHLSQGLPRWAGPRPAKTKNPTSLQLFFRLGTPSCSQKAKTSRFTADLLHFRADIRTLALQNSP